jgi:Tfp pilus assembly protein FimT
MHNTKMPPGKPRRGHHQHRVLRIRTNTRGFSLVELLVLIGVIGIIATVSAPAFISYWRAAALQGGAQELATILNRGRQVAISNNTSVCVSQSGTQVRFLVGGCGGTVWTGAGTNGNGWFTLENNVQVSATTANVVFNFLGAATTSGVYTVTNPVNNSSMHVTVALSGRVTIGP